LTSLAEPSEVHGQGEGRGRMAGRRVLVVGAGTARYDGQAEGKLGNGRAISALIAREGGSVACADRDLDAAQTTATLIAEEGAEGSAHVLQADVSDPAACRDLIPAAVEALGGVDGLVLNVGILGPFGLAGTSAEDWDLLFHVNVRSHALIAGAALGALEEGGSIVFMSSMSAFLPGIGMPAYDMAKAAVMGVMRHVALEGAPRRIRANAVLPGVVDTPLGAASAPPDARDRGRIPLPLGRRGTPWDVAYTTVFLLSGEASYITGQGIVVDGGVTTLFAGS
jgi:NAD(P)-dependent dehydrogenase (short-subunit alcohol dehydrogenase family)